MDFKRSCFGVVLLVEVLLAGASVYVSDPNRSRMVEFYAKNQPCRVISDGAAIRNVLRRPGSSQVHTVNPQEMNELSKTCTNGPVGGLTNSFIFPGTKWCGPGNTARSYNDLGERYEVDRCCREHDHCPMTLEPGQCRRGICNISPFTRSHCDCDQAFKKCLRAVNTEEARLIATLYFDIAQVTCFKDRRSCPTWMRNDLSYSWFCDEWKFLPVEKYSAAPVPAENKTTNHNEIPDETQRKPLDRSKIDADLHVLYRTDEDIEKMMDNPKTEKI